MSGFRREGRSRLDVKLERVGHGWIPASLYDLGLYPGAVPAADSRVWGELYRILEPASVLPTLDELEGYRPGDPDASLYRREEASVTLDDGHQATAWTYFYNAPLGGAQRIESGDYLQHLKVK